MTDGETTTRHEAGAIDEVAAQAWLEERLVRDAMGMVDPFGTAEAIGVEYGVEIEVAYEPLTQVGSGYMLPMRGAEVYLMLLSSRGEPHDRLEAFGHELGHFYLMQILGIPHNPQRDIAHETFCERFAKQISKS